MKYFKPFMTSVTMQWYKLYYTMVKANKASSWFCICDSIIFNNTFITPNMDQSEQCYLNRSSSAILEVGFSQVQHHSKSTLALAYLLVDTRIPTLKHTQPKYGGRFTNIVFEF